MKLLTRYTFIYLFSFEIPAWDQHGTIYSYFETYKCFGSKMQVCVPVGASLNCVQTPAGAVATAAALSAALLPPLAWRLCFLQEWGEVGGDWCGETTGDVESDWTMH